MRLKKLIVQGFKSFADRTEFLFDAPITGIVGPNGCGKSNVVDAFKWVLGEQSAKSLRGSAMMDVIFNGSGQRKAAGMSEVTLVFENPQLPTGGRLLAIDADEVSVGRRLFRDGTSDYRLNNSAARLKDIRDLFLDTGVGMDAYSVIEQGRVAALLEANPEQRRIIFEEAAGISKFKQKKKEAERKLEKVDQNLLRVTDIVDEVARQLRSVKVQAGRARTYQEHAARLRELRLSYAVQEYHTQYHKLQEVTSQREDVQFRLDDASTDLQRRSDEIAIKRQTQQELTTNQQRHEYELVQARAALESSRQRQQYAQRQLEQIAEQAASLQRDQQLAEQKREQGQALLVQAQTQLEELTQQLQAHQGQIDQKQQAYRDQQLELNRLNQSSESHKTVILDLMRQLARINSRLGAIEIERKNIAQQQTRLGERRRIVIERLEQLDQEQATLQAQLEQVTCKAESQQAQLEVSRSQTAALSQQLAELSDRLGKLREQRSGLASRQKLLQDLEARREGVSEGVKSVLRQRESKFSFVRGLVADVLRVDVADAGVVEAALDGRDQWLVITQSTDALEHESALSELSGRVNFISQDCTASNDPAEVTDGQLAQWATEGHSARRALDLAVFDPADASIARYLLARTLVVENLSDAVALRRSGLQGYRFVTAAGQVLESDGILRAGPLGASMGLLSRRSELEATAHQITQADQQIADLSAQLAQGNEQSKALAEAQGALRNEIYQTSTQKVELNGQVSRNRDQQSALLRERPVLDRELEQLFAQFGQLKTEEDQLSQQRQQLEADQQARQTEIASMSQQQTDLNQLIKSLGEALTLARVAMGELQQKQLSARQQVQRQAAQNQELGEQLQRMRHSGESLAARSQQTTAELQQTQYQQHQLQADIDRLTQESSQLAQRAAELSRVIDELSASLQISRKAQAELEHELHGLEIQSSELRVRLDSLIERAREELELDLPQKYAELCHAQPEDAAADEDGSIDADGSSGSADTEDTTDSNRPVTGYIPPQLDWDQVAQEIKSLREKIQRLGNVNLDAIGQQDELEQREQFLAAQVADLTQSKRQLEELIAAINTESGLRFEQTFNAVREHFQTMFRKLFGGGRADIVLQTEVIDKKASAEAGLDGQPSAVVMKKVDILDAGIEIIARPPGKQPVSINQLSGGEKTMTCIALLMSIFKSKPSPFCILDEVDAALDEANNARFNDIVREFLDQSQFIVITHSKRTMQMADVLYGVTMQEQGVSRRVAVKFDQVNQDGQFAETAAA